MHIRIDLDHDEPLFSQLIQQVKDGVTDGTLKAGDPLPSIRQLARDLEVNTKTVAKAYRLLERDSVIQTKGYRGTFIHPHAKTNSTADLNGLILKALGDSVTACRTAGATDSEIRIAFGHVMNDHHTQGGQS